MSSEQTNLPITPTIESLSLKTNKMGGRTDIEFLTGDGVKLRGYFFTPENYTSGTKLPCLVMAHGFSAVKDMDMPYFAEQFTKALTLSVIVYDHRGYGSSDTGPGQPRNEINPYLQISDYQDAITYVSGREEVDPSKIGVWGSSYSAGHCFYLGAFDKRVKAVISQVPFTNGLEIMKRLIRADVGAGVNQLLAGDRLGRAAGQKAGVIPVVNDDPLGFAALPTPDAFKFLKNVESQNIGWQNEVTMRSVELLRTYNPTTAIEEISPSPLLMVVAERDDLTPTDLALKAYNRALEPKELLILKGGHFDAYGGENQKNNLAKQTEFLKKTLCA